MPLWIVLELLSSVEKHKLIKVTNNLKVTQGVNVF